MVSTQEDKVRMLKISNINRDQRPRGSNLLSNRVEEIREEEDDDDFIDFIVIIGKIRFLKK